MPTLSRRILLLAGSAVLVALLATLTPRPTLAQDVDLSHAVPLDAETLAETGIADGYRDVLPLLRRYVENPVPVRELINEDATRYAVMAEGVRYPVYGPSTADDQAWGNATYALFAMINRQLRHTPVRFYALGSGNDLAGIFLTEAQYQAALARIDNPGEQPYLPTAKAPWYGLPH